MAQLYYYTFKENGSNDDYTVTNHGTAGGTALTGYGAYPSWTNVTMVSTMGNGYPKCGRFQSSTYCMCVGAPSTFTALTYIAGIHYYGVNGTSTMGFLWDMGYGGFDQFGHVRPLLGPSGVGVATPRTGGPVPAALGGSDRDSVS